MYNLVGQQRFGIIYGVACIIGLIERTHVLILVKKKKKIKMLQRYYAKLSLWFAIISIFVHTYLFGFTFHDIASLKKCYARWKDGLLSSHGGILLYILNFNR